MGDMKKISRRGGTLPKGTLLKQQYQIENVLGRGGFGITYRAIDINLQVQVAVKELLSDNGVQRERTMREARIAASLYDLEAIVTVRDYFIENDIAYIVMEYVHGISVKDYVMQHGRMDGEEVLREMQPLVVSLQKIHEKGILHRDISVDNLLITQEGKLKLIDFGAASHVQADAREEHTVLIKRGFAAIEQYRAEEPLGAWSDVYSLCATMYFMITGIVPQDAMERWIDDKLTDLTEIYGTGLTTGQAVAIMRGLEVTSQKRLQTLSELRKALYESVEEDRKLWRDTEQVLPSALQGRGHTRTLRREAKKLLAGSIGNKKKLATVLIALIILTGGIFVVANDRNKQGGSSTFDSTMSPYTVDGNSTLQPQTATDVTDTPSASLQSTKKSKLIRKPCATAKAIKKPTTKATVKPTPTPHRVTQKTPKPSVTRKKSNFEGDLDSLLD